MKKTILLLISTLLITGCANHLRYETLNDPQVIRSEPDKEYFIKLDDKFIISPIINFDIEQQETITATTSEDVTKREIYVPYSGGREFLEVPTGLIMFPVSLVIKIVDVISLGYLPDRVTDKPANFAFSGLNPFLNWESEKRSEKKNLKTINKVIDEKEEVRRVASKNTEFTVAVEGLEDQTFTTNQKGEAEIKLLTKAFMNNLGSIRELEISVGEENKGKDSKTLILDRELRLKIGEGKNHIINFNRVRTPEALADTVLKIEKLGFRKTALDFERFQLNKQDDDFRRKFDQAIAQKEKTY